MAIEASGVGMILRDIEKMVPLDTDVDSCIIAGVDIITTEMQNRAPVRPGGGKLKAAIKTGKPKTGSRGRYVTSGIHRNDWNDEDYYPAYVEFGHGGPHPADPHPFVRPSYDAQKDAAWNAAKAAAIANLQKKGL